MRKRCKRKVRHVLTNPVKFVLDGFVPMASMEEDVERLRIKNHGALQLIVSGKASRTDVDVLIAAVNMAVAIKDTCGLGKEYEKVLDDMHSATYCMARRGLHTDRFIFTGPELRAINEGMEVHDAQIDACTVREIEEASRYVKKRISSGKARVITADLNQPQP